METLFNGFMLDIPAGTFPLSTDSMVLADFAHLPKNAKILDLGAGSGTLGSLLCASDAACSVTGVELNEIAHSAACSNIERNALSARMFAVHGDIRDVRAHFPQGSFDVCISNPPYFSGGFPSASLENARQESTCTPGQLFDAAAWALKFGGDFFLVHKPERLAELCAIASQRNLQAKRLCLVRHKPEHPISMILLAFRKGGKPGLKWDELCLFRPDGNPTEDYKRIFHI